MNDEIKRLKAENDELCIKNKELNKELEYEADTSFIELNEENELLKLELKALKDANVMFMKRYEKKVEEEKKINEVCSRIRCEDTFGHLIGKIPS